MTRFTRGIGLLALASVATVATGCHFQYVNGYRFDYQGVSANKTEHGTLDPSVEAIEIKNRFGDVHVEQTEDEAFWTWSGTCWATEQAVADELLDELKIKIVVEGNTQKWTIGLPERTSDLRGVKSNITVLIPASIAVEIDNKHGDVTALGISGSARLENKHGNIDARDLAGTSRIENEHGDTTAYNLASESKLDCEHGNVIVDGAWGDLTAKCEHGSLTIRNAASFVKTSTEHCETEVVSSGTNVDCDAEHGDLKITMTNLDFTSVVAEAEHSDVEIRIPPSCAPTMDVSIEHGKTFSEVPSWDDNANAPSIKVKAKHGDLRVKHAES